MSNTRSTRYLRFPSGRSVQRLRQDAHKNRQSLDEVAMSAGIDMPWGPALDYLKDKDGLALSGNLKEAYDLSQLVPALGEVNFLVGVPGSYISQTALQALMLSAKVHSDKNIGYCDFAVQKVNKTPGSLYLRNSAPYVDGPRCQKYLDELSRLEAPWDKSFEFVRSNAKKFVSAKVPTQFRFKKEVAAIVAMNPRKFVISKLVAYLHEKALLIADSQVDSLLRLGDVKHWEQLKDQRCAQDRRKLLSHTGSITEQRCLVVEGDKYILRRDVQLTDNDRQGFKDDSVSIKSVLISLSNRMLPWQEAAKDLSDTLDLSGGKKENLLARSSALDVKSSLVSNISPSLS